MSKFGEKRRRRRTSTGQIMVSSGDRSHRGLGSSALDSYRHEQNPQVTPKLVRSASESEIGRGPGEVRSPPSFPLAASPGRGAGGCFFVFSHLAIVTSFCSARF